MFVYYKVRMGDKHLLKPPDKACSDAIQPAF